MKYKFSWWVLVAAYLALGVMLSGCALKQGDESIRHMTREDVQQKIVIGKTTKDTVQAQFGEPTAKVSGHDGQDEWQYIYKERQYDALQFVMSAAGLSEDPKATGKKLIINFTAKGVVSKFSVEDVIEQDKAHWGI